MNSKGILIAAPIVAVLAIFLLPAAIEIIKWLLAVVYELTGEVTDIQILTIFLRIVVFGVPVSAISAAIFASVRKLLAT